MTIVSAHTIIQRPRGEIDQMTPKPGSWTLQEQVKMTFANAPAGGEAEDRQLFCPRFRP